MRKTGKSRKPRGRKSGYPSFREIANHHRLQNSLPIAGEPIDGVAERERMEGEEEGDEWEGEERRWERDTQDDEPGEFA